MTKKKQKSSKHQHNIIYHLSNQSINFRETETKKRSLLARFLVSVKIYSMLFSKDVEERNRQTISNVHVYKLLLLSEEKKVEKEKLIISFPHMLL